MTAKPTPRRFTPLALLLLANFAITTGSASAQFSKTMTPDAIEKLAFRLVSSEHMEDAQKILVPGCKSPRATGVMHALLAKTYMDDPYESRKLSSQVKLELDTALKLDPDSGIVHRIWAEYFNLQGDYKKAIEAARKALAAKKQDADSAYRQLIISYSNLGDYNQAYKCNEERFKYSGDSDANYRNRAIMLEKIGRYPEAIQAWRDALKKRHDDSTVLLLIACMERGGKYQEAIDELTKLLKSNPADDEAMTRRAKLYIKMKKYKEAIADYSSAIKEDPTARLYRERAELYKLTGQTAAAAADLEKAKKEESRL